MKFLCDNCKAKYQIADDKVAGKTVRMKCRKCGHQIEVRSEVTESSVASSPPRPLSEAPRAPQRNSLATSLAGAKPKPLSHAPSALAGAFQKQVQDIGGSIPPAPLAPSVELRATDEWYIAINGVPVGPVRISELRRKAAAGAVNEDSLCWQEGFEEWRPVRTVPELAALVREAMAGGRASLLPEPPRAPGVPKPPVAPRPMTPSPPRAERFSEPPPRPHAPQQNNVLPFHARRGADDPPPASGPVPTPFGGGGLAAAFAPMATPAPPLASPGVAAAAHADPFAWAPPADPFMTPAPAAVALTPPAPSVDPFRVSAAPMAMPAPAPVPALVSVPPPAQQDRRKGAPLWFWPVTLGAIAFGGIAAFRIFAPTPAPVVIQMPAAATAPAPTTEKTAEPLAPVTADSAPAPAETVAKKTAVGAAPRPAAGGPGTQTKATDLSGLLGGSANGSAGPSGGPGGPSGGGASGGFDQAGVERVVANHRAGVKRTCWERGGADQKSSVSVMITATVAPNGTVSNTSSSGDDPVVAKCIENQVRTWTFPAPGETKQLQLPFKFLRQ